MNIREVARKAKVGIGTVSRVLNNPHSVSAELRERVMKAMADLDYAPNVHAQRMWKGRTNTICFVLSNRDLLLSLHAHIIHGVEDFCAMNGYSVLFTRFVYSPDTPPEEIEVPPILRRPGFVDGVILGGVNYANFLRRLDSDKLHYTVFGNNLMGTGEPANGTVAFDDRDGARQAVEYLVRLGHTDIWFVGDVSWVWNQRRYEAYLEVMKRRKLKPRAVVQGLAQTWHELGKRAMRHILESGERCTAVFAGSDYVAAGVIEAAIEARRDVPRNLSVLGFDDLDEFSYFRPRITSVGTAKEKIGEYCALLLIRRIEGGSEQGNLKLPMKLVEGESCAPPPAAAAR